MLRERLVVDVVHHLVRVAVVRRDADLAADFLDGRDKAAHAAVDRLDGLDDCREHARMADHVAVRVVEDDEIVLAGTDGLADLVRDLDGAHLRLEIVSRNLRTRHENAILALVRLLNAAVEEERDVRVLLRLCDTQLRHAVVLDDLAERLCDGLRRECDLRVHAVLVLRERRERDLEALVALKAIERLIDERMRELTRAVGTEVEEDGAVTVLHAAVALDDERNDELIVDAARVARLEARDRAVRCDALGVRDGLVGLLLTIPAMVAIHSVVAAADRRNRADADLLALRLELLEVRLRALRRHVTAVEERVDVDLGDALLLRHLEQRVEVTLVAVHAARGDEAHEMNRAALFLGILHDGDERLVLEEIAVLDVARDARELLVDEAARADVRVADLGVAHLAVRQADELAGCLEVTGVIVCEEAVEDRSLRFLHRVALIELAAETAAIHDDECDRCIFEFCHALTTPSE